MIRDFFSKHAGMFQHWLTSPKLPIALAGIVTTCAGLLPASDGAAQKPEAEPTWEVVLASEVEWTHLLNLDDAEVFVDKGDAEWDLRVLHPEADSGRLLVNEKHASVLW